MGTADSMRTDDFDYDLPEKLIAAHPAEKRDASRLMVVPRGGGKPEHHTFSELPKLLRAGDCLVINDSRVIPARLLGKRSKGGRAEILLLTPETDGRWRAWVKPGRKLPPGSIVRIATQDEDEGIAIRVDEAISEGERILSLAEGSDWNSVIHQYGVMPLPPYIVAARRAERRRAIKQAATESGEIDADEFADEDEAALREDRERYQTVYAREEGSVAAPTAGLHFTESLLDELRAGGIEIRRVTLRVGPGTFAPVKSNDPREHPMHEESFSIQEGEARAIDAVVNDPKRRVVAVGTTVVRVLESLMREKGGIVGGDFSTRLLLLPGDEFRAIDAMITNFHLPRSTLLMLVAAFAGRENILAAYAEAIREGYRFYSYGDAMLIRPD